MPKNDEKQCWFTRIPTPEGTPPADVEWEEGELHQLDGHGTHGYAAIISTLDDGVFLVVPFKDVRTVKPPEPEPKGKGKDDKDDKDKDKSKLFGHQGPSHQGAGHR